MANYNNGPFLAEAIESVLNQSSADWELLIVDDCSRDNSREIITKYLDDKRIHFLQNEINQGYTKNLIKMISESHSDLIGIIDSDDVLDHEAVATMLNVYDLHPEIGFVYSQYQICDENLQPVTLGFCQATPPDQSNLHFHHMNHFKTFRKSVYLQTTGYDSRIFAEDIDLWFKLEEISRGYFVDRVLYYFRTLPNSQSHAPKKRLLCGMTTKFAKYLAYERRQNNSQSLASNVSPVKMFWEMGKGLYLAIRLTDGKYSWFFAKKLLYFGLIIWPWLIKTAIKKI